jgi:hypothetical protein
LAVVVKPLTDFAASLGANTVINQVASSTSAYDALQKYFLTNGEAEVSVASGSR